MREEMAIPAASSEALLMRKPEDRRCSAVVNEFDYMDRFRCAFRDAILVLMIDAMLILLLRSECVRLDHFHFGTPPLFLRHSTAVVPVIGRDWKKFREVSNFYFSGLGDLLPDTFPNGREQEFFSN